MAAGHVTRLNGLGLDHLEGEQRLRNPVGPKEFTGRKIAIRGYSEHVIPLESKKRRDERFGTARVYSCAEARGRKLIPCNRL
jgi:hypothetical protein